MSDTRATAAAREIIELFDCPPRNVTVADKQIIAIDGRSGSGKTSVSQVIRHIDPTVEVLAIENFYRGWYGLKTGPVRLAREVLRPWAVGLPGSARHWDWHKMAWDARTRTVPIPDGPRVVIEGCGSGARLLEPFLTAIVWLETSTRTRFKRAMARDGKTFARYWDAWAEQEQQMLQSEKTPSRADLTLEL